MAIPFGQPSPYLAQWKDPHSHLPQREFSKGPLANPLLKAIRKGYNQQNRFLFIFLVSAGRLFIFGPFQLEADWSRPDQDGDDATRIRLVDEIEFVTLSRVDVISIQLSGLQVNKLLKSHLINKTQFSPWWVVVANIASTYT